MAGGANWGGGYPVGRRYFDTVLPLMSPAEMDFALTVGRRRPPASGPAFRYAELGCGSAFTLIGLAALFPEARFFGADFMPEHVARARHLIAEAGLTNVAVEEASFAELADRPPPEGFDYIAIHGVWTWVSEENRSHLVTLLDRWLVPGGIAYVAYNCAAGWAAAAPIRRIFREAPPGPRDAPLGPARAAVDAWISLGAPAGVAAFWKRLSALPDSYLAHDLGAVHNSPVWHAELADRLAAAKLDFAVPAHFAEPFDALQFAGPTLDFVKQGASAGWGELARDLAHARTFRADLFTRGAPRLASGESRRRLGALKIAPWRPLLAVERKEAKEAGPDPFPDLAEPIAAQLARGEQTVATFAASLDLPPVQALQVALITIARGAARLVRPPDPATQDSVAGLMAALRRRRSDGMMVPGVPAPRLGTVVSLTDEEASALLSEAPEEGATADADTRDGLRRLGLPGDAPQAASSQIQGRV